jgi:cell division protein FtsL
MVKKNLDRSNFFDIYGTIGLKGYMQLKKIFLFVIILVVFLVILKVFLYNILSTSWAKKIQDQEEILALEKENAFLTEEILRLSSLSQISSAAEKLGFQKPEAIVSLTPEISVALK